MDKNNFEIDLFTYALEHLTWEQQKDKIQPLFPKVFPIEAVANTLRRLGTQPNYKRIHFFLSMVPKFKDVSLLQKMVGETLIHRNYNNYSANTELALAVMNKYGISSSKFHMHPLTITLKQADDITIIIKVLDETMKNQEFLNQYQKDIEPLVLDYFERTSSSDTHETKGFELNQKEKEFNKKLYVKLLTDLNIKNITFIPEYLPKSGLACGMNLNSYLNLFKKLALQTVFLHEHNLLDYINLEAWEDYKTQILQATIKEFQNFYYAQPASSSEKIAQESQEKKLNFIRLKGYDLMRMRVIQKAYDFYQEFDKRYQQINTFEPFNIILQQDIQLACYNFFKKNIILENEDGDKNDFISIEKLFSSLHTENNLHIIEQPAFLGIEKFILSLNNITKKYKESPTKTL